MLASFRLAVPIHQRSFAWTEEQVSELWEDLSRARYDDPDGYFIGPIVIGETTSAGERIIVIDGQQRLATISLLFAAVISFFRKMGDDDRARIIDSRYLAERDIVSLEREPKLVLGSEDDEFFRQLIEAAVSGGELPSPEVRKPSQELIRGAYDFLVGRVVHICEEAGGNWREELLAFRDFVDASVEVIVVRVGTDQNAYLIFETLNDRGLRLTTSDLLKNHLFGQAGNRLDLVRRRWTEMTSALAGIGEDDPTPEFLRHFWISTRGMVREKALYRTISRDIRTPAAAAKLASGLASSAERYGSLANPAHPQWRTTQVRRALTVFQMFRVTTPRPLLLAAIEELAEKTFEAALVAISGWSIRLAISGGLGSGTVEEAYGEAARRVRKGEIGSVAKLKTYLKSTLPSDEEFEAAFSTKGMRNRRQARFLLAELEKQARRQLGRSEELEANLDESQVNLEHVMPHNLEGAAWNHVRADDHPLYVDRLGNMALMLRGENLEAGSHGFKKKKSFYAMSELVLTAEIAELKEWSPDTISERQRRLAKLAVLAWPL